MAKSLNEILSSIEDAGKGLDQKVQEALQKAEKTSKGFEEIKNGIESGEITKEKANAYIDNLKQNQKSLQKEIDKISDKIKFDKKLKKKVEKIIENEEITLSQKLDKLKKLYEKDLESFEYVSEYYLKIVGEIENKISDVEKYTEDYNNLKKLFDEIKDSKEIPEEKKAKIKEILQIHKDLAKLDIKKEDLAKKIEGAKYNKEELEKALEEIQKEIGDLRLAIAKKFGELKEIKGVLLNTLNGDEQKKPKQKKPKEKKPKEKKPKEKQEQEENPYNYSEKDLKNRKKILGGDGYFSKMTEIKENDEELLEIIENQEILYLDSIVDYNDKIIEAIKGGKCGSVLLNPNANNFTKLIKIDKDNIDFSLNKDDIDLPFIKSILPVGKNSNVSIRLNNEDNILNKKEILEYLQKKDKLYSIYFNDKNISLLVENSGNIINKINMEMGMQELSNMVDRLTEDDFEKEPISLKKIVNRKYKFLGKLFPNNEKAQSQFWAIVSNPSKEGRHGIKFNLLENKKASIEERKKALKCFINGNGYIPSIDKYLRVKEGNYEGRINNTPLSKYLLDLGIDKRNS